MASRDGRLLWVDDAFCAALGRPRDSLVSAHLADILDLGPEEISGWETGDGMVWLPAGGGGLALRVTALAEPGGRPWAYVIEVEGEPGSASPESVAPAVFALRRGGKLMALWGRTREVLGVTHVAVGRRLPSLLKEDPLIGVLVRRTLRGESTTGLFVGQGNSRRLHLFPATDPADDGPGVIGVAMDAPGFQRDRPGIARGRIDRDRALAELGLMALKSVNTGPVLEAAASLVHRALGAEACAVCEYLPGGQGLHVRAAVGLPLSASRLVASAGSSPLVTVSATVGLSEAPDGSLVVPIDGPPAFGCLAVRFGPGRRLMAEDKGFVLAAAQMVSAALGRIAADEHRRQAVVHDPLTGLPGRTLIEDHLNHALARSKRHQSDVGLLYLDLDGFKLVNDTLGHAAGDELLVAVARRLLATVRPSDTLGRLGDDEFMVVCEDLRGEADARAVAYRLAASFQEPFHLSGTDVSVSASVGVALAGATTGPAALQAEADAALYQAKMVEGSSVVLCDDELRSAGHGWFGKG
ncbi:MAG: diguanylate cyclase domain-containing protein [Acidimicrobiia bacterium]